MDNDGKELQVARVTKEFRVEMAHRLMNHPGACKNIHGHSYRIEVTFEGLVDHDTGMVKDFKSIKNTVGKYLDDTFDHVLVLQDSDPVLATLNKSRGPCDADWEPLRVLELDCPPTAENMAIIIGERWAEAGVVEVKVWETATAHATWRAV